MKARAEELRAMRGGQKKSDYLTALVKTIDEMPKEDQEIAIAVHQIVSEVAPDLIPRTWYEMPARGKDGDVVVFVQVSSQFGMRYSTLGFQGATLLDDGDMWPTSYAIMQITDEVKSTIRSLITRATAPEHSDDRR